MAKVRYTAEAIATIKRYAGIKTADEIAIMIGRDKQSLKNFCSRNKISLRIKGQNHHASILSDLQREMVTALSHAGFSDSEIQQAAFSHVSRGCIEKYCVRQ